MQPYDILIVGGGPAGSTLAYCLRDSGLKIGILDKQSFPRQKVCAGWVTPEVMRILNIDLEDYAQKRVLQAINGFKISQLQQKQIESIYPGDPVSYGIRRIEFDQYLLQRCEASVLPPQACKLIKKTDDGWLINDAIQTKLLVGAGGHYCPVARAIGSKQTGELAVVAQEAEFLMSAEQKQNCSIQPQVPELFFTPDLKGYGWVFRKGDYLNIGLGREDKHKLPGHVKSFCEYLAKLGKIPDDISAHYDGHAYLLYHHAERKLIKEDALLIGDSAGLAYPQSGEGIRPAVESAILAANVIRDCAGDYSLANLQAYNSTMEQRFGKRQAGPSLMERLPTWMKKTLASQLMKTRWFTKNIVTDKWFLQSHQEPMPAIKK